MTPNERAEEIVRKIIECQYSEAPLATHIEESIREAEERVRRETIEECANAINVGDLAPKEYGHHKRYQDGYRAALVEAEAIISALSPSRPKGEG